MSKTFKRVLIMSASAGNGHVRAADALEKAFRESGCAEEVRNIDSLKYASPLVRHLYSKTYIDMVNKTPALLGILYDAADKPWQAEHRRLAFHRINTWPLIRYIKKYNPDLVVCTHPLPAEIVSSLLCKGKLHAKHALVVTDFDMHSMWLTRHLDYYFTAIEETRQHLLRLGAGEAKIKVTGIPIDPQFAHLPSKEDARKKLGLAPDKKTIMVSAGGFGVGRITEILSHLMQVDQPVQVLAMCGKNADLKDSILLSGDFNRNDSKVNIIPVGYITNMYEYMAASDLMIGKPGGLTTSEALAADLVMVIVNPIPGQEERNADHLLEEGAAIRCNNLPALTYKVNGLLSDPERVDELRKNVQRLAHPNAAMDIVNILVTSGATTGDKYSKQHSCTTRIERLLKVSRRLSNGVFDGPSEARPKIFSPRQLDFLSKFPKETR